MTRQEWIDICEEEIKRNETLIESANNQIKYLNKEIARQRGIDQEMVEWVWSTGVVTEWEMSHYHKGYQSDDMRNLINRRAREYDWRTKLRKWVKHWNNELTELTNR